MKNPWDAEQRVDADLARKLIRERSPDVAAERVELLGEGWDNVAYLVDGTWVYRFPRREFPVQFLLNECRFLPEIAPRVPLPIPVPGVVGSPTAEFPWPFVRHRCLEGVTADRARLTEEQRRRLAPALGRFLRTVHDLDIEGVPGDVIGRMDPAKKVPAAIERLTKLAELGAIARPDPWLPLLSSLPRSPLPPCLLHGDLYGRHLLLDGNATLAGVIDWGDLHRGDPACDLMVAFTFLPRAEFEEGYGPIDDATARLARFRALSHTLGVTLYALDIRDEDLLREGRRALDEIAR